MTAIGFTGTQLGMTDAQLSQVRHRLVYTFADSFHAGDCIGADAQAMEAAKNYGLRVVSHPPEDDCKRAYFAADETLSPLPYLERNRAIVDATDELVAAPATMAEERRSGTWATVRYARKVGRPVTICWPDGTVTRERRNRG